MNTASPEAAVVTPQLFTVEQFCQREPAFKVGGVRWLIFKDAASLESAGALVRLGRRVLIDRPKFFGWIDAQQRTTRAA